TDPAMHGPSKVAGETRFVLDLRSLSDTTMEVVAAEARAAAERISAAYRVRIDLGATSDSPAAVMDGRLRARLMSLLDRPFEMASGAGHDAAVFTKVGIPSARRVVLDACPLDAAAERYFAPFTDRLAVVVADVTEPETWRPALARHAVTRIVHGATITPISRGTATAAKREPEAENPDRIIDVNVMGTVAVLEWARTLPDLKRFIYV